MSNNYQNWEDDEELDFEDEDQPTQRNVKNEDPIKQLRRALNAANKKNKELETQVSEWNSKQREKVISDVLAERGVNPKIAKLIPSDIDATNVDALNVWLEEYGDAFGIPQGNNDSSNNLDDFKRINSATSSAGLMTNVNDVESNIESAQSEEELYAYLQSLN